MTTPSDLILYQYDGCPFCIRVKRAAKQLGVALEERNILTHAEHRDELANARGRTTVPVLRIQHGDGREEWMPESADIVRYLERRFG